MLDLIKDQIHKIIYSTDASAYRERPEAIFYPKNEKDLISVVKYAYKNGKYVIPRGAGTSLAGQVVGSGIVVDVSKHLNKILEFNEQHKWVRVQPGVVLDELNLFLKEYNLFFAPETSTSNRCNIGGMIGNNSCGSHSLIYGSTRDHLIEVKAILADGSVAIFNSLTTEELDQKCKGDGLESGIYRSLRQILTDKKNISDIEENYPDPRLRRRNTGYALDELLHDSTFNLCKLIAGSEGTLAFVSEAKLKLEPLPPNENALICAHCSTLEHAFRANLIALKNSPFAVELIDKRILDLSKENLAQSKNRFFVKGDPAAILIIELVAKTVNELTANCDKLETDLIESGLVYHNSKVTGEDISKVWELRKAGLGLLTSMKGDAKPVSVIEDTAVVPELLPEYLAEFGKMLEKYGLSSVYHAHIGTGELHLRPILNLKSKDDVEIFHKVAYESALLVKKYKGSLSGEHGDGRLRGEFLPVVFGEDVFNLLKKVKTIFDPNLVFNRNKIVDTPPMSESLRYIPGKSQEFIDTYFDFSKEGGWLSAIEQCNGSGDCRKSIQFPGVMCPSYKVSLDERDTTRARANILRELLSFPQTKKIFDQREILEILDLCLSCKGCKRECPSNVDMAKYKAEYLQQSYRVKGVPLNVYLISHMALFQKIGSVLPQMYNFFISNKLTSGIIKYLLKFASEKELPTLSKISMRKYAALYLNKGIYKYTVYLFADEFTNYIDAEIGIKFIELLNILGYKVIIPRHKESGRASISKGLLTRAKKLANSNVILLKDIITPETPLIGVEPSTILTFRDEYPVLVDSALRDSAVELGKNSLLYDEFIMREYRAGNISSASFTKDKMVIKLHGHCHQKALAYPKESLDMLSIPENYTATMIEAGCCGMAGAFGYEKAHASFSKKIAELQLYPQIRKTPQDVVISAPGTSCRQQIKEGTDVKAKHPVEILREAISNN